MSSTDTTRALTIKHTSYRVLGWVCLAFFIFCGVMSWRAGAYSAALVFLGFIALGSFAILSSGSMQVDSDSIRYYLPLRIYQIKWNEVKYIEIDSQGANMVFVGENKKLAVNGPMFWCGKDKLDTAMLVSAQIDKYGIEIRPTEKAGFRLSRNTRVGALGDR